MNRSLIFVGLILGLGACQPVGGDATVSPSVARDAVPTNADWSLTTNEGAADLSFRQDDSTEGAPLFRLGCRLNTQQVRADWQGDGDAVLTSGTATGTFRKRGDTAADHPVFAAFRSGGTLSVGLDDADLTLSAKDEGRARIAAFFDFCTRPLPPPPEPEPEPAPPPAEAVAAPSEGDDQPDDLPGVEPVEPGIDVDQPDHTTHQAVDG